jgi:hypothetical protein
LTQNEATESGHQYADVLGQSYEYPRRYRNQIRTGEQLVYYRGRRTTAGGMQPQVYLGTGVIGEISQEGAEGLLTCKIEDYRPFPAPLSFKDGDEYREVGARAYDQGQAGLYFRTGVRVIDQNNFEAIVEAGWAGVVPFDVVPPAVTSDSYASPEMVKLVDGIAMDLAEVEAERRWPDATVRRMPHNNPGFDLRIEHQGQPDAYVEVKGTTRVSPVFFLTEGERAFAEAHAARYHFWVFFEIDVDARTGHLAPHAGALVEPDVRLQAAQWVGTLDFADPE